MRPLAAWQLAANLAWFCASFAALLSLPGCDTGGSYEGDEGSEPGTDPSSDPGSMPAPGSVLPSLFGTPQQTGQGSSDDRWYKTEVKRDGDSYLFMANGWGPNFQSQSVSWNGTAF